MLWGDGYPTLERGASYVCVKIRFCEKRGVFGYFLKFHNTFSGPGYVKCRKLVCVMFRTFASFFESVLVSKLSLAANTESWKVGRYASPSKLFH
jgi:hypothetical protein